MIINFLQYLAIPFYVKVLLVIFFILLAFYVFTKMMGALLWGIGISLGIWFLLNYIGISLSLGLLAVIVGVLTAFFFFKNLF